MTNYNKDRIPVTVFECILCKRKKEYLPGELAKIGAPFCEFCLVPMASAERRKENTKEEDTNERNTEGND